MADTMQFDLVSPERRLASVAAREVQIPGAEGDLTAMPGHAPLITTLRPGVLKVAGAAGSADYLVTGGFAEINEASVSVLAEQAIPVGEVTGAIIDALVAEASQRAATALPEDKDQADKLLSEVQGLRALVA